MLRPPRASGYLYPWGLGLAVFLGVASLAASGEPLRLHPENPHYFLFRGRPTVLVTSGEHYGAVLNRAFDGRKYLETLARLGFNLTRTFSGVYCEPPGAFGIVDNPLAPSEGQLICPWARSQEPGYARGGHKFDLARWDDEYFRRLKQFVANAGEKGIVVEFVLFCPFYELSQWQISPLNAANNVNGTGRIGHLDVYNLSDKAVTDQQLALVGKVVAELAAFDNVYYEICNEPYFGGVTLAWQRQMADAIVAAEKQLGVRHLIAQNIANQTARIEDPHPEVSIFNFHYATPPQAVETNYHWNRAIGDDETGFRGREPAAYRSEAWEFLLAGGSVFSNLDYSFSVGHEDGTAVTDAPGSGGREIQTQLRIVKQFLDGLPLVRMKPDQAALARVEPAATQVRVLAEAGQVYALYLRGESPAVVTLRLPDGRYEASWIDTRRGEVVRRETVVAQEGGTDLHSPSFDGDLALQLQRTS